MTLHKAFGVIQCCQAPRPDGRKGSLGRWLLELQCISKESKPSRLDQMVAEIVERASGKATLSVLPWLGLVQFFAIIVPSLVGRRSAFRSRISNPKSRQSCYILFIMHQPAPLGRPTNRRAVYVMYQRLLYTNADEHGRLSQAPLCAIGCVPHTAAPAQPRPIAPWYIHTSHL